MRGLDDQIARLEMRAEQMGIHLQDLGRSSPEAVRVRSELYAMLQQLAELKADRERRKARSTRSPAQGKPFILVDAALQDQEPKARSTRPIR